MERQHVIFEDLGRIGYQEAWTYQESLLAANVEAKMEFRRTSPGSPPRLSSTIHRLLFCEHDPVYTLGKSGNIDHMLLPEPALKEKGIAFFRTNRGGDITYHGPGQVVGYPILDLEKFQTDLGLYLRNIEEVVIRTIAAFGILGERSPGETGVWIDTGKPGRERKICAIGVRCSRWITMHGFALNVNADLDYFNHIIPCGIAQKKVTSLAAELGGPVDIAAVKEMLRVHFQEIFGVQLTKVG